MKPHRLLLRLASSALLAALLAVPAFAVTSATVNLSGSTYIATKNVNGAVSTVYSGSEYYSAINAAILSLTPNRTTKERVTINASGSSGNTPEGVIKAINLRAYTILDFTNKVVTVNPRGAGYRFGVGVRADRADNIEILNVRVAGWPRYGFWITGCNNVRVSGISMPFSTESSSGVTINGIGVRVDNTTRTGYATNFRFEGTGTFSGMTGNAGNNHGLETASLDGVVVGNISSTDIGSCSTLFNTTRNATVGIVTGVRCDQGGGYASFRAANDAGPNVEVRKVISRYCGRGFFTPTNCFDINVAEVDLRNSVQGILLQTGGGATVGTIGVPSYIFDSTNEAIRTDDNHRNSTFNEIALRYNGRGIYETDGAGYNRYVNVDARNGSSTTNAVLGAGSTFTGGYR